ncbi:hypothetical protein E0Z10_g8017 [Xylaria hypoxylon]|uniref:Uncharacterized protein n=1 Tax=Xylaria hypoxylon TaxID=37992 RepID=A0A4Z0YA51_9PEZI|nr:hypothetical protein E0Z10_g8017 [Xylaria hypoxylon]
MDVTVNCLLDFPQGGDPARVCPSLTNDITIVPVPSCGRIAAFDEPSLLFASSNNTLSKRQSGDVSPTCANADGCGGKVCTGYWCDPAPTGFPPGYQDPKDPSSSGASASPTTITQGFPPGNPLPGPINCFDEDDFPGHGDVSASAQDDLSQIFSDIYPEVETIGPNSRAVTLHGTDMHGINYDYSAEWADGCVTTVAEQDFGFPLGSPSLITAYLLVREDYTKFFEMLSQLMLESRQ